MDVKRILDRQAALETRRANWDSLWSEVARRVMPYGDDFDTRHAPGTNRSEQQYDSFPMLALSRFAAALESGLTPRTAMWHHLATGEDEIDENVEVKRYLEALNNRIWRTRYAATSNFSNQAHELYQLLGAFGTGCMLIEDAGNGVRYKSIHTGEIYIAENSHGIVDTIHRKFEMTARQAMQTFGKEAPEKIHKAVAKGHTEDQFCFLHVVMPREDYDPERLDAQGKPFTDTYVFLDDRSIIKDDGFYEMPFACPRYVTSSRETYGRSPAINLLADVKMLNNMRYTTIEAANLTIDPPMLLIDDGIMSEFRMEAGARNYGGVDSEGRQLVHPLQTGADIGLGLEMIQDTKHQIDDGFLGAYFRVLLENPNMTATQALLLAQQQGQMTAPVVGRLQTEFLGPLIRRESGILHRQGKHPPMPEVLAEWLASEEQPLGIDYESPMTRAARSEDAVAILRTFESLAPMAQVDPTVYARFNVSEVAQILADVNGVPAKALYTDDEMEAKKAQQEQAQALGQILEAAPIAAETAKTLSDIQVQSQNNPGVAA